MFGRSPRLAVYRDRPLLIALCQGGAFRFLNGTDGVKDMGVCAFHAQYPAVRLHPLRHTVAYFGESEFGFRPAGAEAGGSSLTGRAVDLPVRGLSVEPDTDLIVAVRDWLPTSKKGTPRLLKRKLVIGICLNQYRGSAVWPRPFGSPPERDR